MVKNAFNSLKGTDRLIYILGQSGTISFSEILKKGIAESTLTLHLKELANKKYY